MEEAEEFRKYVENREKEKDWKIFELKEVE